MIETQTKQPGSKSPSGWDGRDLLEVRNLTVDFYTPRGAARAVDNVSFSIAPGEVFGLAGESGCGKSTAAHAIESQADFDKWIKSKSGAATSFE